MVAHGVMMVILAGLAGGLPPPLATRDGVTTVTLAGLAGGLPPPRRTRAVSPLSVGP